MADSPPPRSRAFVSYSHADAEHLTRLHVHLAPYTREHKVDVWDDTRITPGARWKDEIKQAVASAKVAILLVSADFMASEFIANDELPPLLEAAEQEGTLIVPVILSPCSFQWSKLARYQSLNAPSDPLIDMPRGKQEAIWAKLARQVADSLTSGPIGQISTLSRRDYHPSPIDVLAPSLPAVPARVQVAVAASEPLQQAALGTLLFTYPGVIWGLDWSPDGKRIASGGKDGSIHV